MADANAPLAPGAMAPAWANLPGVDGRPHSLAELAEAKVIVVAFLSNVCPFSEDYEDRLNAFAREYAPRGVRVVAINVQAQTEEDESLEAMKERALAKRFVFGYLKDPSQAIGKAYGAKVTPHFFVLSAHRRIAYVGAFDDARKPERVQKRYLRDAVEALLTGRDPAPNQTRAAGCSIDYR